MWTLNTVSTTRLEYIGLLIRSADCDLLATHRDQLLHLPLFHEEPFK